MACGESCNNKEVTTQNKCANSGNGYGYVIIIVLYILLAIIIGSCLF